MPDFDEVESVNPRRRVDTVDTMGGRARNEDYEQVIDEICRGLPEVEFGTSWGDRPTYKVRGKGFLLYRSPHHTAIDPETGEPYDDLLVITTPDAAEKQALVDDDRLPFFTIPHFDGYNAVLVQQSRLGEVEREELIEIITEAWAAKAPKTLVRKHFEHE
jgi:hypothetical protein